MNKRQLIEAIKDYPDDAPVVVAADNRIIRLIHEEYYSDDSGGARIYSVSGDPKVIRLEL